MFDFNTLKDNTFCIYDVKEWQVDKIKDIMEELWIDERHFTSYDYYIMDTETGYFGRGKSCFDANRKNTKETYRKTATEFLEEYEEWKLRQEVPEEFYKKGGKEPHYKQYLGKKYAVRCETREEKKRVLKALDGHIRWMNGKEPSEFNPEFNYIVLGNTLTQASEPYDYTILSVVEFFEEEEFNIKETIQKVKDYKDENFIINKPNIINKTMSTIKRVLMSKEDKALEHFNLGTSKDLNKEGKLELLDYIFATDDKIKKEFLENIVKAWEETKK